jgi:hypothetical protein
LLLQVFGEGVLYDLTPQEVTHQLKNLSVSVGKDKEKKHKKRRKKTGGYLIKHRHPKKKKKKKKKFARTQGILWSLAWNSHTHTRISLFLNTI